MEVCLSMATAKPFWDPHETNDLYFCLDAESMEQKFRAQYRDSSMGFEAPTASRGEGDQVVPSFKRLSVYEQQQHGPSHRSSQRAPKPLPPLPDPSDLSSDETVDSEVEFFTSMDDERQRLMPEHRSSKALAFRYGANGRRSYRGCGQINYAYFEGAKGSCLSGQGQEKGYGHAHGHGHGHKREQREPPTLLPRDCARQPERPQRRLRRTHSGPAGSFKTAGLRLFGHCASSSAAAAAASNTNNSSNNGSHGSNSHGVQLQDKPEVPPRVPIPPLPAKSAELRQRWSMVVPSPPPDSDNDDDDGDKPPEIPPREPIPQSHVPRPTSPKSLPIYVNGVMPPTQSFAPNPKYVSKAPQHRTMHEPHCTCPAGPGSGHNPCILPIMEDGKKASATHYFLLPNRPAYLDRYTRFFRERDCETDQGPCS